MSVRVQLSPLLRKYIQDYNIATGVQLTTDAPKSVDQIVEELNIPRKEVISIMVNGYPGKFDSIVNEGDSLTLAKVIGGG